VASFKPIDYVGLAAALLQRIDELVARWLPHGVERNARWYVGDFDGGAGESANVNLRTGQWIDNAAPDQDVGGDLISLYARIHGMSQHAAAIELMDLVGMGHHPGDDLPPARPGAQASVPAGQAGSPPPWDAPAPAQASADVPAAAGAAQAPREKAERWVPVVPVPAHAPAPKFVWAYKDKNTDRWVELEAVRTWEYTFEGERYGHVARFERVSSSTGAVVKDTLPLTWCEDTQDGRGGHRWHWKQWKAPRPLYVPATLLSDGGALPVVVVEGEKCAEAGHQLLGHEFDFVSWPGGCKAWQLARWAWLMGRTVYLWPDCDAKRKPLSRDQRDANVDPGTQPVLPESMQPGMRAMMGIGAELLAQQACTVLMCRLPAPGSVADGWDLADAVAEGWDAAKVRDFIRGAVVFQAPDDAVRAAADAKNAARSMAGAGQGDGSTEEAGARPWKRGLLLSSTGSVKAVRENVVLALDGLPDLQVPGVPDAAGLIAYNEFTNNVELTRDAPWGAPAGAWGEADELLMGEWLVRQHMLPSMPRGTLEEAVLMVATRHSHHPLRDQLAAMQGTWDGVKRLDTWLARVCLEEDEHDETDPLHQYLARVGTWMVMGMCARVLPVLKQGRVQVQGPGTKFDYMLILEGRQGWGKSTICKVLGGDDYTADTGLVLGDKDSYQNLQGKWIYEWGELDSLNKAEVQKVKQFISSERDRFRASFDRRPRDYPRQCVFIGTTNEDHYLTDPTGNRRFWPVRLTRPADLAWLREHRDQLLAEALHHLAAGDRFFPTAKEQRDLFDPQQQTRTVESAILNAFQHYLYDQDQKVPHGGENGALVNRVSLSKLLACVGYTVDKQTAQIMKQAGAALKVLGWTVSRSSEPGRPRYYIRPGVQEKLAAQATTTSTGPTQGQDGEGDDDCPF
jgi:putative DNA primase/helicase